MGSEEEFSVALTSLHKTGGMLRLVLKQTNEQEAFDVQTPTGPVTMDTEIQDENDISIEEANRRSLEMLTTMEGKTQPSEPIEKTCSDEKDNKSSNTPRKSSIRHKIESASIISKDLGLDNIEKCGRVPVFTQSSVSNFSSEKPVPSKVRHVSSGTSSAGTDKNEKKQGRGRQRQRKKKRRHRSSSSSSSSTSTSGTSSSATSSTSSDSSDEGYHYYKKTGKKKRKSSPSLKKMLQKCEKRVISKVGKDMAQCTQKFKEDIISDVTASILQRLEGAVLQSFVVPNGGTAQTNEPPKSAEGQAKRMLYQHKNVVCDNCEMEIFGPRFKCGNCSDYDLCEKCEAIEGLHTPSHVFMKMHYPAVHAGRRSVGGKSRPLLRANIYEEREKEREMEDLLQRKLDSGSELNQKVIEKYEKRRTKMKDDEQAKEAFDNRKEEWKKMKKEIRKNKKEVKKKLKQQGKIIQRNMNITKTNTKDEILMNKDGFVFDPPKFENKILNETVVKEPSTLTFESKSPDENLSSALDSLQIVSPQPTPNVVDLCDEDDAVNVMDVCDGESSVSGLDLCDHECSTGSGNATDQTESDVVVISRPNDLVDFNRSHMRSPTAEDFIMVSNYFDLSIPLDERHVQEHRNCESCQNCRNDFTPDFIPVHSICSNTTNELPMDLVASSVPAPASIHPEIVSSSTMNIMDQSIESLSSASTAPSISPEIVQLCDDVLHPEIVHVEMVQPEVVQPEVVQPEVVQPEVIQPEVVQSSQLTPICLSPGANPISVEPVQSVPILKQPVNELCPVVSNEHAVESTATLSEMGEPVGNIVTAQPSADCHVITEQVGVDVNNPIIQAQIDREESIRNKCLRQASLNTFNEARTRNESVDSIGSNQQLDVLANDTNTSAPNNSNAGGIGGALVGAMATLVDTVADTVAHVVQSAKGPPKAEYRAGEVEVTMAIDPRVEGMQKLLDMGFFDRPLNDRLLIQHNNDVGRCVADLIAGNNNDWFNSRH